MNNLKVKVDWVHDLHNEVRSASKSLEISLDSNHVIIIFVLKCKPSCIVIISVRIWHQMISWSCLWSNWQQLGSVSVGAAPTVAKLGIIFTIHLNDIKIDDPIVALGGGDPFFTYSKFPFLRSLLVRSHACTLADPPPPSLQLMLPFCPYHQYNQHTLEIILPQNCCCALAMQ